MKKKLLFILLALLVVVFVVSACGGDGDDTNTDTSNTTQTPGGEQNNNTDSDSNNGNSGNNGGGTTDKPVCTTHNWTVTGGTATCTTGGNATYKCSVCSEEKTEAVEALGHDLVKTQTIAPTCSSEGYDQMDCSRCDYSEQQNKKPASLKPEYHNFKETRQEPTCTEKGKSETKCEYCGAGKGEGSAITLPALGHTYERTYGEGETDQTTVTTTPSTCLENGYYTYDCADCEAVLVETYEMLTVETATPEQLARAEAIAATGHDISVKAEEVLATCLTSGYLKETCANGCGETMQTATYEPLGHTYARDGVVEYTYEVVTQPSCAGTGLEWAKCDDCGYVSANDEIPNVDYSREVPATGEHVYTIPAGGENSTCTTQGYRRYKCETCDATEDRDIQPMAPHEWVLNKTNLVEVDGVWTATCKTAGDYPYYCNNCDATSKNEGGEEVTEIRHIFGSFVSQATCIKSAVLLCGACEEQYNAYAGDTAYEATGAHVYNKSEESDIVAPTCTSYGYTVYHCSEDDDCTATEVRDYTARDPHVILEVTADGIATCDTCDKSFINVTTVVVNEYTDPETGKVIVSSNGTRLCPTNCAGPDAGCQIHDMLVFISASTPPEEATKIETEVEGVVTYTTTKEVSSDKPVSMIELDGSYSTTYVIELLDAEGNKIETFSAVVNDVTVDGIKISMNENMNEGMEPDVEGILYIDIAEVANQVATINITASEAGATVNYYTNN